VTLTPDGEVLLSTAKRVESEIQEAISQISGSRELQHGSVSLGGGMTVALYIFPKLLKRFRTIYRNVDLRITTGEADLLLRLLRTLCEQRELLGDLVAVGFHAAIGLVVGVECLNEHEQTAQLQRQGIGLSGD